jgi:hypothetical protein
MIPLTSPPIARRLGFAAILAVAFAGPALALDCPAPQPLTRPGVLKETATQIAVTATLLTTGDNANRIAVIVADLRARYPERGETLRPQRR